MFKGNEYIKNNLPYYYIYVAIAVTLPFILRLFMDFIFPMWSAIGYCVIYYISLFVIVNLENKRVQLLMEKALGDIALEDKKGIMEKIKSLSPAMYQNDPAIELLRKNYPEFWQYQKKLDMLLAVASLCGFWLLIVLGVGIGFLRK